ncbi:MAG: porin, partial [Polyangiales bacterium]
NYTHAATDLVFKWHGFSLLTEGVLRKASHRANGGTNAAGSHITEYSRSGFGYFTQVGQMLTDKVELTARWDDLHANKGTDPALRKLVRTSGHQLGGGVNVYLNGHAFKLQADYFYIFGSDIGEGSHALRAQLDATF